MYKTTSARRRSMNRQLNRLLTPHPPTPPPRRGSIQTSPTVAGSGEQDDLLKQIQQLELSEGAPATTLLVSLKPKNPARILPTLPELQCSAQQVPSTSQKASERASDTDLAQSRVLLSAVLHQSGPHPSTSRTRAKSELNNRPNGTKAGKQQQMLAYSVQHNSVVCLHQWGTHTVDKACPLSERAPDPNSPKSPWWWCCSLEQALLWRARNPKHCCQSSYHVLHSDGGWDLCCLICQSELEPPTPHCPIPEECDCSSDEELHTFNTLSRY